VLYRSAWQLNGEPMTSASEVIANIGIVMEAMERQLARSRRSDRTGAAIALRHSRRGRDAAFGIGPGKGRVSR
jgi:hypothetical protein